MSFASDRDLLILEPGLFREVMWTGQRLVSGTGTASGTALTMSAQDVSFDSADVGQGHVTVIGGTPYEVLARVSGTVLTISRVRNDVDDPAIAVSGATAVAVLVATFGPQIATVHRQVLRMLGIEPDIEPVEGAVGESSVLNRSEFARLEALGALHLVYSAASSALGPETPLGRKAEFYRARFASERQRAVALIDTDGDGQVDATRRLNVMQFVRH